MKTNQCYTNKIQVSGHDFILNGEKIVLRGFNLGTWMNVENFIMAIPGTDRHIREAFSEVYGREKSAQFFKNFSDAFITRKDFEFFHGLGINAVRIPMNYRRFEDDQNPGNYCEDAFAQIDRVLGLCSQYGIYAILDMHTVPGGQNPDWHADSETGISQFWYDASLRKRIIDLWREFARRYRENPWIAAYDIINEPALVKDGEVFNRFYSEAINIIREYDKDRVILIEGNDWSRDFSLLELPSETQIAYQFHQYPGTFKYPEPYTKEEMEAAFLPAITTLKEKFGRPILLGETGIINVSGREEYYAHMMKLILDIVETNGVSWTLWTYKDAHTMGIVFPKENTPWMRMAGYFKAGYGTGTPLRRENDLLQYELDIADDIVDYIEKKHLGTMDTNTKRHAQYRVRGLLLFLFCELMLKPKLREIPWEEIITYPASFEWKNCDINQKLYNVIKGYTL